MKKVLAVLLTLALMSSVAILPASAALEGDLLGDSTFTSVLSFDEEAVSVGELVKDAVDYASFDPHNYKASIVAEGGESGNALHWTSPEGTSNLSFGGIGFDLAKLGSPTDWSDATDLVFWVDMSDMSADVEVGVTIQFAAGHEYQCSGLGVFVENKDKNWIKWAPAVAGWNRINVPEGYKGWVRISLDPTSWVIADTSTMNNKTGDFDLATVSGVFVSYSVKEGDLGKVALMDSIGTLSGGTGFTSPTTTAKPTTTTKAGDTTTKAGDTTTAAGDTTESSDNTLWIIIGVAAAVVVVGAVVAFVVIKKKKKG